MPNNTERPETTGISVMSFNLRFGHANDGENSWSNRRHAYPEFFKFHTPDFIGIQEANDFQSRLIDTLLPTHSFAGMYEKAPKFWQDNLIFFNRSWQCKKSRRYFLSDTPETESKLPESKWPRQCIIGHFQKNNKNLIHVNTHFDFKEPVQKKSAELVLSFLEEFPNDVPIVITGDFNALPDSDAYRIFSQNGFLDVFSGNHSFTYHRFTGEEAGGHIDWILYKGGIKLEKALVIREQFSGFYPSDHFPVLAEFEL